MIIDFKKLDETKLLNFKGGEKEFSANMYCDESIKIMKGKLVPGATIGYHKHECNSEIIYVLKGCGNVLYDGQMFELNEGESHYCPKGHEHSLINNSNEDLIFFAVVPEL